jgi:hypothetical protein
MLAVGIGRCSAMLLDVWLTGGLFMTLAARHHKADLRAAVRFEKDFP